MRQRLYMPDDQTWEGPTDAELAAFLADANREQRKSLERIAEGLESEAVSKH
jgi:hypothetical protein